MMTKIFCFGYALLFAIKSEIFLSKSVFSDNLCWFLVSLTFLTLFILYKLNPPYRSWVPMVVIWLLVIILLPFLTDDLLTFILCLEFTIFPMSMLILAVSGDRDKMGSVLLMMLFNGAGSIGFVAFVISKYYGGNLSISTLMTSQSFISEDILFLGAIFVLVTKLPIMMFHFWLTKAHVSASTLCSIFLASVMLKLAGLGLIKVMPHLSGTVSSLSLVCAFSMVSGMFFTFIMTRSLDLKNFVALSSVVHMGLLLFLALYGESFGTKGMVMAMVAHGVASSMLFYSAGVLYEKSLTRSMLFSKAQRSMKPEDTFFFILFILINAGLPPFLGFLSEVVTVKSVMSFSIWALLPFSIWMVMFMIASIILIMNLIHSKLLLYYKFAPKTTTLMYLAITVIHISFILF